MNLFEEADGNTVEKLRGLIQGQSTYLSCGVGSKSGQCIKLFVKKDKARKRIVSV
jgi:hypothetical protein